MLRYENFCNVGITIDLLTDDYYISAFGKADYENGRYKISLYLSKHDIDFLDLIDDEIEIEASQQEIRKEITMFVTEKLREGFFDSYIERYEYQLRCIEKGIDLEEAKR